MLLGRVRFHLSGDVNVDGVYLSDFRRGRYDQLDEPMIGGDFEAVRGKWGMRGEVAAFVADNFQSSDLRVITGRSFDGGFGVDRRAGDYTLSGTVLVHSESYDAPLAVSQAGDVAAGARTCR